MFYAAEFFLLAGKSALALGQLFLTDFFLISAMIEKCFKFESIHTLRVSGVSPTAGRIKVQFDR